MRGCLLQRVYILLFVLATSLRRTAAQFLFLTGPASRLRFSNPACEASECLSVCTAAFRTAFQPWTDSSGNLFGFRVGISNNLFNTVPEDASATACNCAQTCWASYQLDPSDRGPTANEFFMFTRFTSTLAKQLGRTPTLSFTCSGSTVAVNSTIALAGLAPSSPDKAIWLQFPQGFQGAPPSLGSCSAAFAVPQAPDQYSSFALGLSSQDSAPVPTGFATRLSTQPPQCAAQADACFAACTGAATQVLYIDSSYSDSGDWALVTRWIFGPAAGAGLPPGCQCPDTSCVSVDTRANVSLGMSRSELAAASAARSAQLARAGGVPFSCSGNASLADLRVTEVAGYGTPTRPEKALVFSWVNATRCIGVYAVSSGQVLNVTARTSVTPQTQIWAPPLPPQPPSPPSPPNPPPPPISPPPPAPPGRRRALEVGLAVGLACGLCAMLGVCIFIGYMYRREKKGKPVFKPSPSITRRQARNVAVGLEQEIEDAKIPETQV